MSISSGKGQGRPPADRPIPPAFPELLAPAGSVEAYVAAVAAGADAVYLGLQKFNARERAENFTVDDLCRVLPHARRHGVRVYLAMNTLLGEEDLPEAIGLLHRIGPLAPDAVIVQDLGFMRIVREHFPGIPLHVSTQAGCASLAAAEVFRALGAERVILERHLDLAEVRRIVARARVGIEIFVHGAMCFSFSGKCFFSSYLGGKSANRGACVQPCRRLYGHPGGEEAIFSTRDLSLLDLLPELVPLGFAALKIEGRMRDAEYVGAVVSAYRTALDLIRDGRPGEAVTEGRRRLAAAIGREGTKGLVGGVPATDVVAGGGTGNVGEPLGAVREVRDGWARIDPGPGIARGDRLRVQFLRDGSGKGFSARAVREDGTALYVRIPFEVEAGDLLFRVAGGGRAEISRRARQEMEAQPAEGVRFHVLAGEGTVTVQACYGKIRREYPFRVAGGLGPSAGAAREARLPADAAERLRAAYRFDLPIGEVRVEGRGAGVAWPDLTELFLKAARKFDKDFYLAGKELRLAVLPTLRVAGSRREEQPALLYVGCRADQLGALPKDPAIVPVVEFSKAVARDPQAALRSFRDQAFLYIPPPLLERDGSFLRRTVEDAVRRGHRRWVVSDLGHFRLFRGQGRRREVTLISDHYLYAFNTGALSVLSRLGARRMILPVEARLSDLRAAGRFLYGLGIATVYGAVPLMISRLLPASGAGEIEVVSPRGERFAVAAGERGSVVRPAVPFSASGSLGEIRAAGIRDFYADLRALPEGGIGAVLSALLADREIPGTSSFNLFRAGF